MTEEELQQIIKETWETFDGVPAYGSWVAFSESIAAAEWYRALTSTDRGSASHLVKAALEVGVETVPRQQPIAYETALRDEIEATSYGSVVAETLFEEGKDAEEEPELTQAESERLGTEVLETANISVDDAMKMTGDQLVEAGIGEEDIDPVTAAIEAAAAQSSVSRQTMQLYGLVASEIEEFIANLQEEALVSGVGDFSIIDTIGLLESGDPAVNGLAAELAVGNTYDRVFIKLPSGGDFFVDGGEYREALSVVGESNSDLLSYAIVAAEENGFAHDDGWKNFVLTAVYNQKSVSQGGLAAVTDIEVQLPNLTAGVAGVSRRSMIGSRLQSEAREYSQHLRKYNGVHALAMLAAGGRQDLADEAFRSGGLSAQGRQDVADFIVGLGDERELLALDINTNDKYWLQLTQGPAGGVGAEAGLSMLPNSEDSREAYRTLYRSFFMEDPADGVLDGFAENVKSQYLEFDAASRQGANMFRDEPARERELREALRSPEAMAMEQVRNNPQYQSLYGQRGSMTEAQYKTQFQNRVAGFGGDVGASTDAIQAGMRTGRGSTTTGRLLFSEEGKQAQGLQGRLAQAAGVIARNT